MISSVFCSFRGASNDHNVSETEDVTVYKSSEFVSFCSYSIYCMSGILVALPEVSVFSVIAYLKRLGIETWHRVLNRL